MDTNNAVIQLCVQGTQAEFRGEMDAACSLYRQAWEAAQDDFEACVAAHYVARCHEDPHEQLHWNRIALERADAVGDGRVQSFYPSLYLNMGQSYERIGQPEEARRWYDLAAELGVPHQ
jgi:tetratricopeptide (TPR) repeat protein